MKKSNLFRLLEYAGNYRYLTVASWILSACSALLALVPFWYIWKILQEVLETAPVFSEAKQMVHNGWMAVLFAVLSILIYIGALMCSHLAAFRIASNIRIQTIHHIVQLPLGFMSCFGSGKMRKIVNESSVAAETYLAHQLPDKASAIATPVGLLALLFIFDYRLGLFSLIPVILAFLIMLSMTGAKMRQKMTEYQNATDEEVIQAAKLANCDIFVNRLPQKWNTSIGENGCTLSGGERQRISIARAFLKDAPIILLDEATASLDVENETLIQQALSRLIKNKTVLVIAHRMRTVAGADQIVVLADGAAAEQGPPEVLMKKHGLYSQMIQIQEQSQNWTL